MEFEQAIEIATVRTFRVPDVGRVRVEIGDTVTREIEYGRYAHGHNYPAYRVSIDGETVTFGSDWGVPVSQSTDDVDAMLNLLGWVARDRDDEWFELWVSTRQEIRAALSAPWATGDPREVARAGYRGELG